MKFLIIKCLVNWKKRILTRRLSNHDFIVVRIRWQKQNLNKCIKISSKVCYSFKKNRKLAHSEQVGIVIGIFFLTFPFLLSALFIH